MFNIKWVSNKFSFSLLYTKEIHNLHFLTLKKVFQFELLRFLRRERILNFNEYFIKLNMKVSKKANRSNVNDRLLKKSH